MAQRLRDGPRERRRPPSPFDELRASAALLLWGLLSEKPVNGRARKALSTAAKQFWGTAIHPLVGGGFAAAEAPAAIRAGPGHLPSSPTCTLAAASVQELAMGLHHGPPAPKFFTGAEERYGQALFERTWGGADAATSVWLLATLPPATRRDPLVGELALDWLLWDAPWLANKPAAAWLLQSSLVASGPLSRKAISSILRSRVGLYRLLDVVGGRGLRLRDQLTGTVRLIRTPTPVWPDPERSLLVRIYRFGSWWLAAGEGFLMPAIDTRRFLACARQTSLAHGARGWPDPHWHGWIKSWLLPLAARHWLGSPSAPG